MQKLTPALAALTVLLVSTPAFAADGDATNMGLFGLGAGIAMGLAALGGTLGQSNAAKGAYESIARNPQAADKLNTPFFVGLAFIESLVLFTFAIAFLLITGLGGNIAA